MLVIRPVRQEDATSMAELVSLTRGAITTLPPDPDLLRRRIRQSEAAFLEAADRPGGELYTFVLEHTGRRGQLLGTASVVSKTGGFDPFYCYELRDERYKSDLLKVDRLVHTLHLVEDHSGPSEIGGLFLRPGARGGGFGRLLSVARLLFMAGRPRSFEKHVVAEIRGMTDEAGNSPFWDAIGRLFFGVSFPVADQMSFKEKQVIADLMPEHPIYTDMLPLAAREVIGLEHDFARPARRLLEAEGFTFKNRVDIFDAGPTLECPLDAIRAVHESKTAEVMSLHDEPDERADALVCNDRIDFLATPAMVRERDGGIELSAPAARAIGVEPGQSVRYVATRPTPPTRSDEVDLYQSIPLPAET
jgi:arginine N-succinyltransferase